MEETLWPYQTVKHRGRRYCLTHLGFGLNVDLAISKAIVDKVLLFSSDACTDLGERNKLQSKRVSENNVPPTQLTRRSVFSYCGELVGHYPVCGWLRVATAFIKREANRVSSRWEEPIHDDRIQEHLGEVAREVSKNDPARCQWDVSGSAARVWVDASALALRVPLEVDNSVIEDAVWLRPNDARHINMAELDAVIKGLNLAIAWRMRTIELMTDSAAVHRWLSDGLSAKLSGINCSRLQRLCNGRSFVPVALVKLRTLNDG
ncbi:hypothetical protein M514_09040 [Trichuris suis]|uniref:Uncharacterized protein n=1 Tax=Trichuris suis TaxID=68888 RepID=A0A085MZA9_9BILA|nr:hypothetical protein M514_09040 [Trichuris suis]